MFETEQDVLDWYEAQPRAISAEFLRAFPWAEVRQHVLPAQLVPILIYMRDVESFTDIYHKELLLTPTGKDPWISKFMDRWVVEEAQHAALLNQFMAEAGVPTGPRWERDAKARITRRYTVENYITSAITNCFGTYFTGTHMVWGAINEMTTLQGYRRLWRLAGHPVLERLLRAVAQEESIHSHFYWSIARLHLKRSKFAVRLARSVITRYWTPVGQGAKPKNETDYVIGTLFGDGPGLEFFDRNVSRRVKRLPGFVGVDSVTRRVAKVPPPPTPAAMSAAHV